MGGLYGNTGWHATTRDGQQRTVIRTWGRTVGRLEERVEDEEAEAASGEQAARARSASHNFTRYVWSNRPWLRGDPPEGQLHPGEFRPVSPGAGTTTVVWQYRCACNLGLSQHSRWGLVNMDLATGLGLQEMWVPNY
jgi:hypothetical protein